jgi:hypothetical protein
MHGDIKIKFVEKYYVGRFVIMNRQGVVLFDYLGQESPDLRPRAQMHPCALCYAPMELKEDGLTYVF